MILYDNYQINTQGHLTVDGVDTVALAKEYGTPLMVMSHARIVEDCRNLKSIMAGCFGENHKIAYASKAFSAKFLYRILQPLGLHVDVVSGGEIYTALAAGYDPALLHFHGSNKTAEELAYALNCGIGSFVIDNMAEVGLLARLADEKGVKPTVLLRVKPGVDAHTHEFITTGHADTKFGFGIADGLAEAAIQEILNYPILQFVGLHCHIGSQIFLSEPYGLAGKIMMEFLADVNKKYGLHLSELILGGGFGIKYMPDDAPESAQAMLSAAATAIQAVCTHRGIAMPCVTIEPGRSIVGPAGITLYEVGTVKELKGIRNYVSVNGGMTDNPRCSLYDATYHAVVANRADGPADYVATIAGKCCESDLLSQHISMQKPQTGDVLATFSTGAYNYAMASNYNKTPRPAVVLVQDGVATLVIRRETNEDLIRLEI